MKLIDAFVDHCLTWHEGANAFDRQYLANRTLALVGDAAIEADATGNWLTDLDALVAQAIANGCIEDGPFAKAQLEADLMDLATPLPSAVNARFWSDMQDSPKTATDHFFALSQANNYIQTRAIAKNEGFTVATEYGDLEITINLSKPEKDPKAIAAAAKQTSHSYPACALCMENEGYAGRLDHPARANHRIIRLMVGGKPWGFQYSPYAYFNEHAIFLNQEHTPMAINQATFTNLLELVTTLPHYFVGSNADLPIVGGSMLAHDHYQGGRHEFAMAKAPVEREFHLPQYPGVTAGTVKWPMSVIRLTSADRTQLINAAETIRQAWATYSDASVNVLAQSDGENHHTITPIARRVGEDYQLDLVLRDNQTSANFPDGIFHPHQDVQHIKKENIGLIEVMGLAILPARLKPELKEVRAFLLDQPNQMAESHRPWAEQLKQSQSWDEATATDQLNQAVGQVFARVLEDAGVFKRNESGQAAFARFIETITMP